MVHSLVDSAARHVDGGHRLAARRHARAGPLLALGAVDLGGEVLSGSRDARQRSLGRRAVITRWREGVDRRWVHGGVVAYQYLVQLLSGGVDGVGGVRGVV